MATNMPPLIGKPNKTQTNVVNWMSLGLWMASILTPMVLQVVDRVKAKKDEAPK
jgi:hypothetical protein